MLIGFSLLMLSLVEGRGPRHPTATASHHHPHPSPNKKFLQDEQLLHDKQHIAEDLGSWADDPHNQLSEEEMEFRYFKVHDHDNNTLLDGLEIYHAIKHTIESSEGSQESEPWPEKEMTIVELIDQLLEENDKNNDGYLSYAEFTIGRKKQKEQHR